MYDVRYNICDVIQNVRNRQRDFYYNIISLSIHNVKVQCWYQILIDRLSYLLRFYY